MKKMKKIFILIFISLPMLIVAQVLTPPDLEYSSNPDTVLDGAFEKIHNETKTVAYKYPTIKEKDIVWSRTIWREIDLKQKINHHFYFPTIEKRENLNPEKMSLIDVVMEELQYGDTSLFRAFNVPLNTVPGNEFKYGALTPEQIMIIGATLSDSIPKKDESGKVLRDTFSLGLNAAGELYGTNEILMKPGEIEDFKRPEVQSWWIKEEWFFDKHRSSMDVRIIGLCPIRTYEKDQKIRKEPLFWIYFPEWRDLLVQTKVANFTKNNAQQRSYLGIFEKRMFGSRILQESNIMNRSIPDYMIGLDALLESERIKEEIFNIEHDMWEY
jgi:gliding motility associated protien GldN